MARRADECRNIDVEVPRIFGEQMVAQQEIARLQSLLDECEEEIRETQRIILKADDPGALAVDLSAHILKKSSPELRKIPTGLTSLLASLFAGPSASVAPRRKGTLRLGSGRSPGQQKYPAGASKRVQASLDDLAEIFLEIGDIVSEEYAKYELVLKEMERRLEELSEKARRYNSEIAEHQRQLISKHFLLERYRENWGKLNCGPGFPIRPDGLLPVEIPADVRRQ